MLTLTTTTPALCHITFAIQVVGVANAVSIVDCLSWVWVCVRACARSWWMMVFSFHVIPTLCLCHALFFLPLVHSLIACPKYFLFDVQCYDFYCYCDCHWSCAKQKVLKLAQLKCEKSPFFAYRIESRLQNNRYKSTHCFKQWNFNIQVACACKHVHHFLNDIRCCNHFLLLK